MAAESAGQVLERGSTTKGPTTVTLALAEYDRTRPLIDGRVKAEGLNLRINTAWIGDFCVRPVYEEFDAAEMSLSWYVMARTRGEPVISLPVFPLRMAVLAYVFVRKDSSYQKPADLVGKRVATKFYRITVNLWLRGIFQEHYGVRPQDLNWVITTPNEGAGFIMPPGVNIVKQSGASPEELLERGDVDAIFCPELPLEFLAGRSNMRRLFTNPQAEMENYVRKAGHVPITHTIVMKQALFEKSPEIARSLTRAFNNAQDMCDAYWNADPKHLSFADSVFFLEQQRALYGGSSYIQGLEKNRRTLETFVRYAHEQGYISRRPSIEELFPLAED